MADTRRELAALQTLEADNSSGSISAQVLRDGEITSHPSKVVQTSAFASPPSGPITGDLWLPNDGIAINRYSGSAWTPWGPLFPLASPSAQTWAWVNQDTATETAVGNGFCLTSASKGSHSVMMRKKSAPSAPYKVDLMLSGCDNFAGAGNQWIFGGAWRQSSDGKIVTAGLVLNSGASASTPGWLELWIEKWSSATATSSSYQDFTTYPLSGPIFLRLEDDNTNRKISLSTNGQVWTLTHSVGRTDYMTADEVGWFIDPRSIAGQATLHSWYEH